MQMGAVQSWSFGKALEAQDGGSEIGGLNDVLSAKTMPMHLDSLFNTKVIDEAGHEKRDSAYPKSRTKFDAREQRIPGPGQENRPCAIRQSGLQLLVIR